MTALPRAFAAALLLCLTQNALAHAVLLSSSPGAEAVLDSAPVEIRLGFNENVGPIFVRVLDVSGREVGGAGDFRVAGNDVFLPLNAELPDGTYVVTYRVISADTHPVGGSVVFAVGEPLADTGGVEAAGTTVSGWQLPVAVNRFALYAAGTLAAGSALLLLLLSPPPAVARFTRRQGALAAKVTAVALVLAVGLGGAEMLAGGAGALFAAAAWQTGAGSTLGPSAVIGLPGALLLAWAFARQLPPPAALALGAALVLGSYLVTGHAATAPPAWAMALVVGLHLVAVAFWFAALAPLGRAVGTEAPEAAGRLLVSFSLRAVYAVALLILSGAVIAWVQVRSPAALLSTDYGLRLTLKGVVVVAILALALRNKRTLTARLTASPAGGAAALKRSIRTEYWLMMVVMALAVSLTLPSPPRALVAVAGAKASAGVTVEAVNGPVRVTLEVTPARVGENMLMLSFRDEAGAAVAMQRVRVFLSLPAASLDGIEKEAAMVEPGVYHLMASETIIPGDWDVRIDAFVDDFDKRILRTTVPIR